jgi:phage recombination protein Bet
MEYTKEQIKVLVDNKIIPASATPSQISYFFEVCKRKRLDPFLKQMHMIERKSKEGDKWVTSYTIQASLDGMRAIAQRNAKIKSYKRWTEYKKGYDGKEQIYGCCEINTEDRGLYSDSVPFNEYVQKTRDGSIAHFWKQLPETMIKKVAEESVLRMLAPEDLSGVYGDEEMQQADSEVKLLEEPEVKSDLKIVEHNYTEEAQRCQNLKELKAWYTALNDKEKSDYKGLYTHVADEIKKLVSLTKRIDESDGITLLSDEEDLRKQVTEVDCNKELKEKTLRYLSDKLTEYERKAS